MMLTIFVHLYFCKAHVVYCFIKNIDYKTNSIILFLTFKTFKIKNNLYYILIEKNIIC